MTGMSAVMGCSTPLHRATTRAPFTTSERWTQAFEGQFGKPTPLRRMSSKMSLAASSNVRVLTVRVVSVAMMGGMMAHGRGGVH